MDTLPRLKCSQMVNVTAGVVQKGGLILVARRKTGSPLGGYWEFPGGKLMDGESPEQCLERELMEELNIQVRVGRHLLDNLHHYPEKSVCLIAYFAEYLAGEITYTDHDRVEWVSPHQLKDFLFAPADRPIAKCLQDMFPSAPVK